MYSVNYVFFNECNVKAFTLFAGHSVKDFEVQNCHGTDLQIKIVNTK
jgi:hypothetical protein